MRKMCLISAATAAALTSSGYAATLTALTGFGNGDGWRAPGEVVTGDTAGSATGGVYNYLGTGALERGLAYNPVTGNLVLVSRSTAGNGIRLLNGTTGADFGALPQGTGIITGGQFAINKAGVAPDGTIYVGNLTLNVSTSAFKLYSFAGEAAAGPAVAFNSTISGFTGTPRLGDTLDTSRSTTTFVAGASGSVGYAVLSGATPTATAVAAFAGTGAPAAGDFRIGATFAGTDNDVWGKQTGGTAVAAPLRRTSYSGSTGTALGSSTLLSGGEGPVDYIVISGVPYLASLDVNSSIVRVYDVSAPATPTLVASLTTAVAPLTANGNAAGDIAWGAVSGPNATLYAMSTNQGIQAFTFNIPEPSTLAALGLAGVVVRRRK